MGDIRPLGKDPATQKQHELVSAIAKVEKFGTPLQQEGSNGQEFLFHCPICIDDDGKGEGHRPHLFIAKAVQLGRAEPFTGCRIHDSPADWQRIKKALISAGVPANLLGDKSAGPNSNVVGKGLDKSAYAEFKSKPMGLGESHPIPEGRIQRWCAALWEDSNTAEMARRYLTGTRGITEATINAAEFGLAGNKLVLPIRGADGLVVSARRRQLRSDGEVSPWKPLPHPKLKKEDGRTPKTYGAPSRLYGVRELALDTADDPLPVWVTAGEFDRLVLLECGALSVCSTNGEGSLPRLEDAEYLIGRDVYIVYDCDAAGRKGARKFATAASKIGANAVYVLDLDPDRHDGYDISDYFRDNDTPEFDAFQELCDRIAVLDPFEPTDATESGLPSTDTEAAEFLLRRHGNDMLFVDTGRARSGYWIIWNGTNWAIDNDGAVERWVADLGREFLPEARAEYQAAKLAGDGSAGELSNLKKVERLLDDGKITSVLNRTKTVQPGITIFPDALDNNDHLLIVGNGALDLTDNGVRLRPGVQADMFTRSTGTDYEPRAKSAAWTDFLHTFLPDPELREFVGRVFGYCLLGRNPDGMIFHFRGKTRTGKSTLLRAVSRALGDYAKPFDLTALRGKFESGPREDVADIMNARLAYVSELSGAWELHADQMKRLTGMDKISYNRKYESQRTDYPDFTAVLAANGMPRVKGADAALRGRFITVPFLASVAERSQKATELDSPEAAMAVLAWIVRGYKRYCKYGIQIDSWPGAVAEATIGSHATMDDADEFISDCCEVDREFYAPTAGFYPAYRHWCDESGISRGDIQSRKVFSEALNDRGYLLAQKKIDGKNTKIRTGIRLNDAYQSISFS